MYYQDLVLAAPSCECRVQGDTALVGTTVATGNLTGRWRTAIIIVTFLTAGIGTEAAAQLRLLIKADGGTDDLIA